MRLPVNARKLALILSLTASTSVLLAACGTQEKQVSYQSGGMTQTFAEGQNAVPKDFSLPVYPNATPTGSVSADGNSQEQSQFLMLSTTDSIDKVSDFYQDKLKDAGWTIDKVDTDPKIININAHKDKLEANVIIADDSGKTTISVSSAKTGDTSKEDAQSKSDDFSPNKLNPPTD